MRILSLIPLLLLLGCSRENATPIKTSTDTNTRIVTIKMPSVAAPSEKTLPNWYVFKIKEFHKVTFSDDGAFAIVEGVTMKGKEFKVKMVWD